MSRLISYESFCELFKSGDISVSREMYKSFEQYAEMLCEWNEKINLTAITDPEGIAVKHFYDSLYPFVICEPKYGEKLIDVGTGAGFPSIPLKIYRSDIQITLLDSLNKRIKFLNEVSDKLALEAECIHGRAEELGRYIKDGNLNRENYDIAAARAVAELRELCEYCLPFVKIGGTFYVLKGKNADEELNNAQTAIKVLGGKTERVEKYSLPNGDERTLILIRKIKETPNKYPRNSGQMKKNPLQR